MMREASVVLGVCQCEIVMLLEVINKKRQQKTSNLPSLKTPLNPAKAQKRKIFCYVIILQ